MSYYQTKESVEEYIQLAKEVDGRNIITKLNQFAPNNATILELGTGPGSDWEILNEDYNITGSDNSEEFLEHLKSTYPTGEFLNLDAVSIQTENQYNTIYSNKVMHHLKDDDLKTSFKNQLNHLSENGIICHSYWKGEGSEVFKGLFVNYHLEEDITSLLEPQFEILLLEEYAEFEEGDSFFVIAKKR